MKKQLNKKWLAKGGLRDRLRRIPTSAVILALLFSALAFMNARSGVGLMLFPNTNWGAGFDLDKVRLRIVEQDQAKPEFEDHAKAARLATEVLIETPLDARALRVLALATAAQGDEAATAAMMRQANSLSRREGIAQIWLAEKAGRAGDSATAMTHIDAVLRTKPEAGELIFAQLSTVIATPDARRLFAPFITESTPWLESFFEQILEKSETVIPLAELMAEVNEPPNLTRLRNSYATILYRLAGAQEYELLEEIYAKFPGATARETGSVSLSESLNSDGYAPVIWELVARSDRGAAPVGNDSVEFFARGGVSGRTGRKVVFLDGTPQRLTFRKTESDNGGRGEAELRLMCFRNDSDLMVERRVSLMALADGASSAVLTPAECRTAVIEVHVDGGSGRSPTRVVLSDFQISRQTVDGADQETDL